MRLAGNTGRKILPSRHHRTTLSCYIFATKARIDIRQSRKNLLNVITSSTRTHNMANFGPLTAEIGSGVWGTPTHFNGFCVLAALLHDTIGSQPNLAALNRRCHLYSAGRPSRWALAHILVMVALCNRADHYFHPVLWSPYVIGRPYIFSCCGLFFLLLLFFPRLISAAGDWMFTILWHMVWP